MKKKNWFVKVASLTMLASIAVISSCNEEERLTAQDTMAISEESVSDSYFEDVDDLSSFIVFEGGYDELGGRVATDGRQSSDDRIECAVISFSPNSTTTSGSITIDFGTGCTVRGNTRSGKIILTYSNGPRSAIGFKIVTTFDNYKINSIQLKGTRTITKVQASAENNIKHDISLVNGEAIWPDNGGSATRAAEFSREWVRDAADEKVLLDGNASGTTRRGKTYSMSITNQLVYRRACILTDGIYMAVQGKKVFSTDGKQITIDYGSGDCDRIVSISVNGVTRNVTVGNN
ncbi:MAG: hypothetical protein JNM57_11520 [Cyclobacteriaceae bacterium]|nr:hypothetical protein [Cyclobacteriaceae bacterium]